MSQTEPGSPAAAGRWGKRNTAVLLVLLGALAAAVAIAWHLWRGLGDVAIGTGGVVVLVVGGLATVGLGAVLIWLMIASDRRGDGGRPGRGG